MTSSTLNVVDVNSMRQLRDGSVAVQVKLVAGTIDPTQAFQMSAELVLPAAVATALADMLDMTMGRKHSPATAESDTLERLMTFFGARVQAVTVSTAVNDKTHCIAVQVGEGSPASPNARCARPPAKND